MSKWYALFASGEDGAGISDWQMGSYLGMEEELINQVGYSEYVGSALVIEIEMPDGVEPPSLYARPIDFELEEEGDDMCDICMRSGVNCSMTTADGRTVCDDCAKDWQDEWDEEGEDE